MSTKFSLWPYTNVAAHRGGGKLAPENTVAGIVASAHFGHKMVEFDAKLSKDNTVFLLHDETLNRTSNGKGAAVSLNYQEIAQFDAGSWLHSRFSDVYMPTLVEAFICCEGYGIDMNIEIKPCRGREAETGELIAREVQLFWKSSTPPLLSSFSVLALEAAKNIAPNIPRGLLCDDLPTDWQHLTKKLGCISLHVNHRYLTQKRVKAIKSTGLFLFAFTVNRLDQARKLLKWGVDCICTDEIALITPQTLKR